MDFPSHITKVFLNNEFVESDGSKKLTVHNPATGDLVSKEIPISNAVDVDAAVRNAHKAFTPGSAWRALTASARQKVLFKFADLLEAHSEELARLTQLTLGAPYGSFGKAEIDTAVGCFRYFAGWTDKYAGQSFPADDGMYKIVRNEPLGVVAGIIPWNSPIASMGLKAAPALATGNVFVLKPSEKTPLAAGALGDLIIEAGFPPGVFQVVPGDGTTGALLASHMDVAKISFTGSITTGKTIQQLAAKSNLKRVTLELGGKSPACIFDDANLENAVQWCVDGLTTNTGQICFATTRVYVQESVFDAFLKLYLEALEAKSEAIGDPTNVKVEVGPVVDKMQFDRIMDIVNTAKQDEQGTLLLGGARHGNKGYFIKPTVFSNTKPNASIYKEEIFGPVAVVNSFKDEAEVLARANDSKYGLMAGIFTQDVQRALRMSSAVDAGVVGVNCISTISFNCPFGGTKESGIGRENGEFALRAYTEPKTVLINMNY